MVVVIAPNIRIRKEVVVVEEEEEEEEEEEKPHIHTASRKIEDLLDISYKSPTYSPLYRHQTSLVLINCKVS
jgi:hypothetical protein